MKVLAITNPTHTQALTTAGKYRPGIPLWWVKNGKFWAEVEGFKTWVLTAPTSKGDA